MLMFVSHLYVEFLFEGSSRVTKLFFFFTFGSQLVFVLPVWCSFPHFSSGLRIQIHAVYWIFRASMKENIGNITHPIQASKQLSSAPDIEAMCLFPVLQLRSLIEAIAQDSGSK